MLSPQRSMLNPGIPGVKALIQFPGLLGMMDKNLSWTSSLGQAYVNGQQDVLAAVQVMRQRAQQAGNLKSTPQESVTTQGNTIVIEPAIRKSCMCRNTIRGSSTVIRSRSIRVGLGVPGFFFDGPGIGFGVGIGIGLFGSFGWGWHHWGTDWHGHGLIHGDRPYFSHSREFGNRNGFGGGSGAVDGGASYGMHSSAFSGFNHGGEARGFSSRGRTSFGGGSHGGGFAGGGFHGGGGGGHR